MAISRRIGQDSEGYPIFKRDSRNNILDDLDHDLDEILGAYQDFERGLLTSTGYSFSIRRSEIDDFLRIDPQRFLPHLNETLDDIQGLDGCDGWSVGSLSQLEPNMEIFKGPRFQSENIIVDDETVNTEPYYTPSAILQEKSDSVKLIDVTRATMRQLEIIRAIRVNRGDIVITRSGSIGRIAYIPRKYDNAIVSDDLIRVRIEDDSLRYYVFHYLQTRYAQDQMKRNEYGAVQQHLEPDHIKNLLVPVPNNWEDISDIIDGIRRTIGLREELEESSERLNADMQAKIEALIGRSSG